MIIKETGITSRKIFEDRMLEKARGQTGRVAPLEEISGPIKIATELELEQSKLMTNMAAELVRVRGGKRGRVKRILDRIDNVREREEANGTEEREKVRIVGEELEKIIKEREQIEKAGKRLIRRTPVEERLRRKTAEKADRLRRESLKRNRQRIEEQTTERAGGQVQRIWNRYIRGINGYRTILDTTSTTGESLDQNLLTGGYQDSVSEEGSGVGVYVEGQYYDLLPTYEPLIALDPTNSVGAQTGEGQTEEPPPVYVSQVAGEGDSGVVPPQEGLVREGQDHEVSSLAGSSHIVNEPAEEESRYRPGTSRISGRRRIWNILTGRPRRRNTLDAPQPEDNPGVSSRAGGQDSEQVSPERAESVARYERAIGEIIRKKQGEGEDISMAYDPNGDVNLAWVLQCLNEGEQSPFYYSISKFFIEEYKRRIRVNESGRTVLNPTDNYSEKNFFIFSMTIKNGFNLHQSEIDTGSYLIKKHDDDKNVAKNKRADERTAYEEELVREDDEGQTLNITILNSPTTDDAGYRT
jgi:hypothetical protein